MNERYEIGVRGRLEHRYDWFPGMRVENQDDQVILRGTVVDQAALHGVLATIRDLNLELLFVRCLEKSASSDPDHSDAFENLSAERKE